MQEKKQQTQGFTLGRSEYGIVFGYFGPLFWYSIFASQVNYFFAVLSVSGAAGLTNWTNKPPNSNKPTPMPTISRQTGFLFYMFKHFGRTPRTFS